MPESTQSHRPWLWLTVGVIALTTVNFLRQLPETHSLGALVFGDPGFALSVDAMLDEGRVPTKDFTYYYGLLGIVIDRVWYAAWGRTADADTALLAVCNLAIGLGLVRFARAVDFSSPARWLLLAGIPVAIMPLRYTSPTQGMDAALMVHSLAYLAGGRYRSAFTLAVIEVLVKSALGSVYAAGLVALVLFGPRPSPSGWCERWRELIPGAVVGTILTTILAFLFGPGPVWETLFPVAGAKTYAGEHFGFFFGIGRQFWLRLPFDPVYYLFGPAGFWLLASGVMLVGLPSLLRDRVDPRAMALLTVAGLHLVFVCLLFGNDQSWLYYSFLPVLGACGVIGRSGMAGFWPRWVVVGLPVIAVCSWVGFAVHARVIWEETVCTEATGGLFAQPKDAAAWAQVREWGRQQNVFVLNPSGAGRVLFPEVESNRSWALLPEVAVPTEVDALLSRLRTADRVVVHPVTRPMFEEWPPFASDLAQFEDDPLITAETTFRVLRRKSSRQGGG